MPDDYYNDVAHGGKAFNDDGSDDCAGCGHDRSYHRNNKYACYWMQGFDGPLCSCMGFKMSKLEAVKGRLSRLLTIRGPNP